MLADYLKESSSKHDVSAFIIHDKAQTTELPFIPLTLA
jgi:hypothetical protein